MNKEMTMVDVDAQLAAKVKIMRHQDGGFQRKLTRERLTGISAALTNGVICPPITIAKIRDQYILIDGQHRFSAWQLKPFPLKATIVVMQNVDEAMESFIAMNREQKRVSLSHILNISNDDYAIKVRALATGCNVSIPHIHNLMRGIVAVGNRSSSLLNSGRVTEDHWKIAARVMGFWMKDRRWGKEGNVFSAVGTLEFVGFFAGKSTAIDSILKDLSRLDYSKQGAIGRSIGTSWASQKIVKAIVYKALAEKIL